VSSMDGDAGPVPHGSVHAPPPSMKEASRKPTAAEKAAEKMWEDLITTRLGEKGARWTRVSRVFQWEMAMLIFVRDEQLRLVKNVQEAKVATGVGSVIGNKGGLLTKLEFGSTSMCFVSSHLAAHSW